MSFDLAQLKARLPSLVAAKGLSADLLQRASQTARAQGMGFCAAMVSLGVAESVVQELMSAGTGLPMLTVLPTTDPGVGAGFDELRCRAMQLCPLVREPDGSYVFGCVDPLVATSPDMKALPPHRLVLVTRSMLESALSRVFGVPTDPEKHHVARTQVLKAVDLRDGLPPIIGGFQRLARIGEGGMAVVYRAQEVTTGREVALKVMLPHLARDKEFVHRFLQEAQASLRLSHPHTVAVYGAGEDHGAPFIASEFIDRGTLEDLLKQTGPMPAPLALELFAQSLDGVAAAHDVGIIHRDLKPANLLLSSAGLVKVGDFGIAKLTGAAKLTQTGIVVGTPAYMSPEQATGAPLSPASDLFAMGVILYELLSGTNPHHADSGTAAVMRVLTASVPPIMRMVPTVPVEVEAMLHRLLIKDPAARSSSAREWLPQLAKWLEPWRANGQNVVQAALENPRQACLAIAEQEARQLFALARPLALAGGPDRRRAALLLYRAVLLAPSDAAIGAVFRDVCTAERLTFGEATNPKIHELENAWAATPDAPGVLLQLANLYRLEGNIWRAAFFLRSYVRLRPQDGYAIGQLAQLTGEAAVPPPAAPRQSTSNPSLPPVRSSNPSLPPVRPSSPTLPAGPGAASAPTQSQPSDQQPTMHLAAAPNAQPQAAPADSFREYDEDEAAPLPVTLWRTHGRTITSVGGVVLLVFVIVKLLLSFVDSATAPVKVVRQPYVPPAGQYPGTKPLDEASVLIQAARADLDAGNAPGAVNRLNDFMTRFASSERYDEAKLLRAEAYLELNNFPNAQADASDVIARQAPGNPLHRRAVELADRARSGMGALPKSPQPTPPPPEPPPEPQPEELPPDEPSR